MNEKRLLRVIMISLFMSLGILLAFQFSVYAYYAGIPTLPFTQQISSIQNTPFTSSTLNSSFYRDFYTTYGTQASTFANPFSTYGSTSMLYADPFSQASANTMSYANIFGVTIESGQGSYRDPFYTTGGKYINYSSPVGGFSSDQAYSMSLLGGSTSSSFSLTTPWTHVSSDINTAYGPGFAGTSLAHTAFGMPTIFNLTGMNPAAAGTVALLAYGSETAAMDRMIQQSNTYAYTKEGMPYTPVASYYNANSYGGTNYFFAGDISYQETGTVGTGPFTTGYNVVQELPSSWVPAVGATVGAAALTGWFGGGIAASTGGTSTGSYGGWSGQSAGWGVVSGGWGGGGYVGGGVGGYVGGGGTYVSGGGTTYGGVNLGW
ncbi:MAG: hypothetical protein ACMUIM_00500 [bacterium]